MKRFATYFLLTTALLAVASQASGDIKKRDTIKSLEGDEVEVRPGDIILDSTDLARENYRAFLELTAQDPQQRAEAMRRLGDLELDVAERQQLTDNVMAAETPGYRKAVELYEQLLEEFPDYRANDRVLYQLSRAYEMGGRGDEALEVLNRLVSRYPETEVRPEVQFRRGEMLFMRKDYNDAEIAYSDVVAHGEASKYYEQSLYKLGWSQFKLGWYEDSFDPFLELLDRMIGDLGVQEHASRLESLSRADQELVEDTFRVLSISFSYMQGAETITRVMEKRGYPAYGYMIYRNLGDLFLEKERFIDAAETYEAFVELHPDHPTAPLIQVEVIEAYKLGGFPSLVLEGKRQFVERYGRNSEYWADKSLEEDTAVASHLKANLYDLAQYSHAEGQENGKVEDYQQAAHWYREYLASFPNEADSASTNFLLAEVLFESKAFDDAVEQYERTAYEYPHHDKSAEAGYAAILAYREHEETLPDSSQSDEERASWRHRYLDSALRFANVFPDHEESGAVMTTVAEDLFARDEFGRAIEVGQAVVSKQPAVEPEQARTAWTVIAHSQFDLGNFAEAEQAYYKLQTFLPVDDAEAEQEIDDRIASAIYKQGEQAREMGMLEEAVGHFSRLGDVVPDSDIRSTAEYDAAAVLINMEDWDRASAALEQFRKDYPESEFNEEITQNLAVTYSNSGRQAEAAEEFERIAVAQSSSEDVRREALWKAAELYEQANEANSERRVLEDIVARYPNPLSESIEARYRLLELAEQYGTEQQRIARLEDLVRADANAGAQRSDRSRYLAARASLELAEPVQRRFEAARLTQPLAASMKSKRSLMEDVLEAYRKSANYGVAEVTTAATFRLGEVYETFASDLMNSERPNDLDAAALEQYDLLLEEQIYPFEEKAIELYMVNADRAPDGVYDEWVQKSFDRLASLMPARYAKEERSEDVVTALY